MLTLPTHAFCFVSEYILSYQTLNDAGEEVYIKLLRRLDEKSIVCGKTAWHLPNEGNLLYAVHIPENFGHNIIMEVTSPSDNPKDLPKDLVSILSEFKFVQLKK